MLGKLPREEKSGGGLDLAGGDGELLVVTRKFGGLGSDPLEHLVAEGVHDGHALGGDPGIRVNLLQDLVDVNTVGLLSFRPALLCGCVRVLRGSSSSSFGGNRSSRCSGLHRLLSHRHLGRRLDFLR